MTACRGTVTLASRLANLAESRGDDDAFRFLSDPRQPEVSEVVSVTYAQLDRAARTVAAALDSVTRPGERALILFPPGPRYVEAFFGCLYAGVVAVPAYPPDLPSSAERVRAVAADSGAAAFLTTERLLPRCHESVGAGAAGPVAVATDALDGVDPVPGPRRADPADVAFLQYTSGSTGQPRGVMVTTSNLVENIEALAARFCLTAEDRELSWLPPYHDMGLIAGILQPIFLGIETVLMSPFAFLADPMCWPAAISHTGATYSGGPNFAYALCAQRASADRVASLDLSRWRVAFCGAEPIRRASWRSFATALGPARLRQNAFLPGYGLAEATLAVTACDPERPISAMVPAENPAGGSPAASGANELVSVGRPVDGVEVRIVDPDSSVECPPGVVGEIWVAGPGIAAGYWRRERESAETFGGVLASSDAGPGEAQDRDGDADGGRRRFLRTGDLGLMSGGELFVGGRIKDLVIVNGQNLYPQDIEETAWAADRRLRPGGCAAFSVDAEDGERLVVVQECAADLTAEDERALVGLVRAAVRRAHAVDPADVVLVPPRAVHRTSSGKVRRRATRTAYLAGQLPTLLAGSGPRLQAR